MIGGEEHGRFRELVDRHQDIVVTTHMNPDGDALGSQLVVARYLREQGKKVRMVNADPAPETLGFLEGAAEIPVYDAAVHKAWLAEADLVVLVDNSAPDRLGRMEDPMREVADKVLCIDHHPTRGNPWKHNILDTAACATAAIVHELVTEQGFVADDASALAMYVGIATDTGFFRFNSTTAQAHAIASRLLAAGVDPARPYQEIYEGNSEAYTRLLGHALADLRLDAGGAIASVRLTRELQERCGAVDVDSSEMTTALLAMRSVRIAVLFRDLPDGKIKVSLRSKGNVNVHSLATQFGGGGHRNASGIVLDGGMDEAVELVTGKATELLAATDAGSME